MTQTVNVILPNRGATPGHEGLAMIYEPLSHRFEIRRLRANEQAMVGDEQYSAFEADRELDQDNHSHWSLKKRVLRLLPRLKSTLKSKQDGRFQRLEKSFQNPLDERTNDELCSLSVQGGDHVSSRRRRSRCTDLDRPVCRDDRHLGASHLGHVNRLS